jgi:hypothetical protein
MKLKKDKYYQDLEAKGYYENLDKRTKDYKEYKEWLSLKEEPSYEKLKENIEKESKIGLGDVVEKITEATGIKKAIKAVLGDDCGCDERKEKFNKLSVWKRRKVNCISKEDYNWLKSFIDSRTSKISHETNKRLVSVYNRVFGTNQKVSKCTPCVNGLIRNLVEYLDIWEG